jgi:CRISPR-associated endoribonuclease Cas6
MRIKIIFSKPTSEVPLQNQELVVSYLHKCLGRNNEYHNKPSKYCITSILGGSLLKDSLSLDFSSSDGPYIFVTSEDSEFFNKLMLGLFANSDFGFGMKVVDVQTVCSTSFNGYNIFKAITPIVLKEKGGKRYLSIKDEGYEELLKAHTMNKLSKAIPGIDLSGFNLEVMKNLPNKVKKSMYKQTLMTATICSVKITCNKKIAEFIFNNGLGQSTGIGFGSMCHAQDWKEQGFSSQDKGQVVEEQQLVTT